MSPFERYARGIDTDPPPGVAAMLDAAATMFERSEVAIISDVGIGIALSRATRKQVRTLLRHMGSRRIAKRILEMPNDVLPVVLLTSDGVALAAVERWAVNAMGGAA